MKPAARIYTDPYSGVEIFSVTTGPRTSLGVAYDPRRSEPPITWKSDCHHCKACRQRDLSIHTKRELWMLGTQDAAEQDLLRYTVPTYSEPHLVVLESPTTARVSKKDAPPFMAQLSQNAVLYDDKRPHDKILTLCLKVLFSAREASQREVSAIFTLLATVGARRTGGRKHECQIIKWSEILTAISG